MMVDLYSYAIMSNLPATLRSVCAESLILEAMSLKGRIIAVNLDSELRLSCQQTRFLKDDELRKYGKVKGTIEAPVFNREDFKDYLKDATRQKNSELIKDRSLLLFIDKMPEKKVLPALDALVFLIGADHSSIPYVFSLLHSQYESAYKVPVKIVVAGEGKVEKAAEFFIDVRNELEGLRVTGPEFTFAGNIVFDQDQFDLAISSNVPFIEAFSGGVSHGQVRYIINRLMTRDVSRVDMTESEYLQLISML